MKSLASLCVSIVLYNVCIHWNKVQKAFWNMTKCEPYWASRRLWTGPVPAWRKPLAGHCVHNRPWGALFLHAFNSQGHAVWGREVLCLHHPGEWGQLGLNKTECLLSLHSWLLLQLLLLFLLQEDTWRRIRHSGLKVWNVWDVFCCAVSFSPLNHSLWKNQHSKYF